MGIHFRFVDAYKACPKCGADAKLVGRERGAGRPQPEWSWECAAGGHKNGHLREPVRGIGLFRDMNVTSWPAFLHLIVTMRNNYGWVLVENEMRDAYGISNKHTLVEWRRTYQRSLRDALMMSGGLIIGGPGVTVVFGETIVGVHKGVNTRTERERSGGRRKFESPQSRRLTSHVRHVYHIPPNALSYSSHGECRCCGLC